MIVPLEETLCVRVPKPSPAAIGSDALQHWEGAAEIDDRFAELQYRLGRMPGGAQPTGRAQERFELARDLDALRFRADSRINAIVREVAASRRGQNVRLADAERVFSQETGLQCRPWRRAVLRTRASHVRGQLSPGENGSRASSGSFTSSGAFAFRRPRPRPRSAPSDWHSRRGTNSTWPRPWPRLLPIRPSRNSFITPLDRRPPRSAWRICGEPPSSRRLCAKR